MKRTLTSLILSICILLTLALPIFAGGSSGENADDKTAVKAYNGELFTLSKPWVEHTAYEYGIYVDGAYGKATMNRYHITQSTRITLPNNGKSFDVNVIFSVGSDGDTEMKQETMKGGTTFAASDLNRSGSGKVYDSKYSITFEYTGSDTDDFRIQFYVVSGAPAFTDVPDGEYYAEPVAWAVEEGITLGTTNTTFSPNNTCTRGQIITFLWRAAGSPAPKAYGCFTDVPDDSQYYSAAVSWAKENGIATGTSFNPDADCTRAMVVEFLWKYFKSPSADLRTPFTDVPNNSPYATAVTWAVQNNITSGTSATTFSPDASCIRAQIVTFLWRAFV